MSRLTNEQIEALRAESQQDASEGYPKIEIECVTLLEVLDELAAYRGEKWSPEHGGSEVDRLKAIIGELDKQKKKALVERNEARAAGNDLYRSLKALRESGVGQSMNYTPWAGGADAVLKKWEEKP